MLTRRTFLRAAAATGLAAGSLPSRLVARQPTRGSTWLLFTKSADFIHDTIKPREGKGTFLHEHLAPVFAQRRIELIESKDGRLFDPGTIEGFEGFVFYTTGDLTIAGKDAQPPMTGAGRDALLGAVGRGRPFIGLHCASDTFHGEQSPFLAMLGGEFDSHGEQQRATARIVDATFPGIGTADEWSIHEEWYALKNLAGDIRPLQILDTTGMEGAMYQRAPFPITWTRQHGKGRVFYTAIGHRHDVIASHAYRRLIGGAVDWCRGG